MESEGFKSTVVFVGGRPFIQCSYALLNVVRGYKLEDDSIDGLLFDEDLERIEEIDCKISPIDEFWVHCSNLQVWAEMGYASELLDCRIAFPLLRELCKIGDSRASIVFTNEIIKRIKKAYLPVVAYLVENDFLDFLPEEFFRCFSSSDFLKRELLFRVLTPRNRKFWLISMYLFNMLYPYLSELDVSKFISLVKECDSNSNLVYSILFEPQFISLCAVDPDKLSFLRKALILDLINSGDSCKYKLDPEALKHYLNDIHY